MIGHFTEARGDFGYIHPIGPLTTVRNLGNFRAQLGEGFSRLCDFENDNILRNRDNERQLHI